MGAIRRNRDGQVRYLPYQLVIGRSGSSELPLPVSTVSSHHALIRWDSVRWTIADLGSRNGTYVNGQRLISGSTNSRELRLGDELAFAERDEVWTLCDVAAPQPLLIPGNGSPPLPLTEDQLSGLPDENTALGYVYFERVSWRFEDEAGKVHDLSNGQTVLIGDCTYRLHLPGEATETPAAEHPVLERVLSEAEVEIAVSSDEESSAVTAIVRGERFGVQPRTHLYLLAFLARQRLKQHRESGPAEGALGGWVAVEEACRQLGLSPSVLGVMVFRCRKEFERLGFLEAMGIIDRAKKGCLRIGVAAERLRVTPSYR
jgi:hypothetical protein